MAKIDIEVEPPEEELVPVEDEESEDDPESADQKRVNYDINAPNMIPQMVRTKAGQEFVRKVGDLVYNETKDAWDSSEKYRKNAREQWRMFSCEMPEKPARFKDCANLHVPQVLEDVSRLYMRMYIEVVGDGDNFFSVLPVGPDDKDKAELLTKHGNHQLRTELIDLPQQLERAALFFIIPGDVTSHSYYDAHRRLNRHEILTPDDVIVPYMYTTTTPNYSDCPWIAKWLRPYRHELQRYRGEWHGVDEVLKRKPSFDEDDITYPLAEAQRKIDGDEPGPDQRAPYKFVHYEGWIELPDQPNEMYCKVIVDWQTKAVMSLTLHMEDDWKDRARFERQSQELEAFRAETLAYPGAVAAHQQAMAQHAMLQGAPVPPPMLGPLGQPIVPPPPPPPPAPPAPPQPPVWAEDPEELLAQDETGAHTFEVEPPRQVPIHMFGHGKGIEPPAGPRGMGTGRILTELNLASNVLYNQFADQATIANSWGGLYAGGTGPKKDIKFQPGVFTCVEGVRPGDLKDAFMEMTPRAANPQMFDMVRFNRELSSAAASAPGILSGEAGKSGETYRGHQARLDQATKQASFITGKYARLVQLIVTNNGRLNAKFMPEDEIVMVNNHKLGTSEEVRVGRRLYERDYRVYMKTDLRFASQAARIEEADQLLAMVATPNPNIPPNPALIQAAFKENFIARGQDQLVPLLGPPIPPPTTGLNIPPPPPPMVDPATGQLMPPQPPGAPPGGAPQPQPAQKPQAPRPPEPPRPSVSGGTPSPGPEA